jgi:hypothetical protein
MSSNRDSQTTARQAKALGIELPPSLLIRA